MSTCWILHIDNDVSFQNAFKRLVEPSGIAVESYCDSGEMLGQSSGKSYELVVIDNSGFDAAKWLQQQDSSLHVVALTADVSNEKRQGIASEGLRVDEWIDKKLGWGQAIKQLVGKLTSGRKRNPDPRPCMLESYEGEVVESHGGTAVVVYEVGDDMVEQVYEQSQFVGGRLPPKGARLKVHVEVSELSASEAELPEPITPEQKDDIQSLLDHAAMLHPYNYLVGRLVRDVWQLVEKGGDYGPQLIQDMKEFLDARKRACEDLPPEARQRLQLMSNEGDSDEKHLLPRQAVIIVYGYSRNVLACVPDFMALFGGHLLVVSCSRMNKFIGGAEYETKRVLEELRGYQRTNRCHCVEVADLHSVLQQLPNDMKPIFLAGARGITPDGEVLNTLGNRMIASATKDHGGQVFVVAEPEKLADFNGRVIRKTDGSPAADDPLAPLGNWREISSSARIDVLRVEKDGDVDLLIGPDLTIVRTEPPEDQEGGLAAAPSK